MARGCAAAVALVALAASWRCTAAACRPAEGASEVGGDCQAPLSADSVLLQTRRGTSRIKAPMGDGLQHGDVVFLTVPRSHHRITVQPDGQVHAKWDRKGSWQRMVLEREAGPGELRSGDVVLFRAWTGKHLTVHGRKMHAKWDDHAASWQKFVIELKMGAIEGVVASIVDPPIASGRTVFLKAHTGKRVDVDTPDAAGMVQARWDDQGSWQELTIEAQAPRSAGGAPTTTEQWFPTTAEPTTTTTTTERIPRCSEVTADLISELLAVTTVQLPAPMSSNCGGFGVRMSCRHNFYAASPRSDFHAIFYNDGVGKAILVLLDGQDKIVRTKALGSEEVRGLQFDPTARHLVALISGATGVYGSPSYFLKLQMPTLDIVWNKSVSSPLVGLEKWTPDNADSIAISEDRYVLHTAGVCRDGKWCSGHQGDILQVLNASTGEQISGEGKDWQSSHSWKQMVAYNSNADSFLIGNAGDYYPKALQFTGFAGGAHLGIKLRMDTWGSGTGRQGVTLGAIKADPEGPGFAAVWSYDEEAGGPDKLYFATVNTSADPRNVTWGIQPKKVFNESVTTQIGGNLAPLGGGRWLVAYTEAASDLISDYLRTTWDNWGISEEVRATGSRVAILSAAGDIVGWPINISAVGAPLPVELGHLVERPNGIGWVALDGPGSQTAKVVRLRCSSGGDNAAG